MYSRTLSAFAVSSLLVAAVATAAPTKFQIGTTRLNPGQISPGWALMTGSDGIAYLVEANGAPVHRWLSPDPNSATLGGVEPLFDTPGNVLALIGTPVIPGCGLDCGKVVEMDWDGNVVWEYIDSTRTLHHDLQRLENGNTMFMCSKILDRPEIAPEPIIDDCLIEVSPDGEVLWEWQTADHYDDLDLTEEEREMIRTSQVRLRGDWSHGNSIDSISSNTPHTDPRFRPGNIIVSYRHLNLIIVIDRDTDEIVWQNRSAIGQHHASMIENGLSGAGNIILFDNGFGGRYPDIARTNSRVIEVDPLTDEIVFSYTATQSGIADWMFFSGFVGSVQRMPNGNTLINEGMYGRSFEVTPNGQMAWEWVNPTSNTNSGFISNAITRIYKVPVDWAGPFKETLSWPTEPAELTAAEAEVMKIPSRWR